MNSCCPDCSGPQMADHPGGILEIAHVGYCGLLPFEDATRDADFQRGQSLPLGFRRLATATEVTLLVSLGYSVPSSLTTGVYFVTPSVRRRTWASITAPSTEGVAP